MISDIYFALAIILLITSLIIVTRVIINHFKYKTKYDFQLLFGLIVPIIFSSLYAILKIILRKSFIYESLEIDGWGQTISVLISVCGIFILSTYLIKLAERSKISFKRWKLWIFALFCFVIFVFLYFLIYYEQIQLFDGDFIFYNNVFPSSTITFNIISFILITPFFIIILFKVNSFTKQWMSKPSRRRMLVMIVFMELNQIIIFLSSILGFLWEILILCRILDFGCIFLVFYVFYHHDVAESMFMLLNVELVYIADENGKVLHVTAFMPGRNKKTFDALIGGLVKSIDNIIKEIKTVRSVGLHRIVLIDKTEIIIEKSKKSNLYYIVFTRTYSKYTHEKIRLLKDKIDNSYGKKLKFISAESEQFSVDRLITEAFLE